LWRFLCNFIDLQSSTREVAGGHTIHEHEDNDNYASCIIMELLIMM
jgi:hypothetical protein